MKKIILLLIIIASAVVADAQLALKSNLLYDAATTPNIGAELGVGERSTVNLVYGLNPWSFSSDDGPRKAKHWVIMPEYRHWFCSRYNGHFVGVHAMGGQYNAANVSLPLPGFFFGGDNLRSEVRDRRVEGWFAGVGVTYGYQWILSRHWNLEAEVGVGYNYTDYSKYICFGCGRKDGSGHSNYLGLTKLGLSFVYIF